MIMNDANFLASLYCFWKQIRMPKTHQIREFTCALCLYSQRINHYSRRLQFNLKINVFLTLKWLWFTIVCLSASGVKSFFVVAKCQRLQSQHSVFISNFTILWIILYISLQWCHNGHDGVPNHQPRDCLFRIRSKKPSKLCVTGLCAGNLPATGEFPAQMASNAENVSILWRDHMSHRTIDYVSHTKIRHRSYYELAYASWIVIKVLSLIYFCCMHVECGIAFSTMVDYRLC